MHLPTPDSTPPTAPVTTPHYALMVFLPAAAATCSAGAAASHGTAQILWGIGAATATTAAVTFSVWRDRKATKAADTAARAADAAAESRTRLATTLSRLAEPVVTALNTVTAAPDTAQRHTALEVLISLVVDHAHTQCWLPQPSTADVRATLYELHGDHLERRRTAGRADTPRPDFHDQRSLHDHEAIRIAKGEHPLIVNDLHTAPPAHFQDSKGRSYRSFLAVPVRGGTTSYGMLVVDSDQPNTFTAIDKHHLLLMSAILGAGYAHVAATVPPTISPCPLHFTPTCEQTRHAAASLVSA
ncbi:hypothetical protein F4553_001970 [Allocatelliglobosispora scoriae]|uniref:GAF domain-containing protein n=1 Tax=Allocatelliglobosispora scoriae TaxID=643052 RepID=A0A841BP36_9ACTN|nr:GAF domain-containing protein [Allocatelliglobosispora scoriae]MBB5868591.1 hypothetical protein [Allocatelliglobosispora scoriae]